MLFKKEQHKKIDQHPYLAICIKSNISQNTKQPFPPPTNRIPPLLQLHVQKRCNAVPRAARAKPTLDTLGHFVALHPSCLGIKGWTTSGRKGRKVGRRGSRALTIARIHLESMHKFSLSPSKLLSWSSLERGRRKNGCGGIRNKSFRP